ncbi:MAG: SIS domain-containing protein [bacterium]|nr:SIS domain-containing protein [bacterium]
MRAKEIARILIKAFKNGGKVLICGNGGSAAEAQHFSTELMVKHKLFRKPLPAISLNTDTSLLTAHANDFDFETIFSRQVEALAKPEDVVIGISSSGKSKNVNLALKEARKQGAAVIDFPREGKGTTQVQEFQLKLIHQICEIVEREMFT